MKNGSKQGINLVDDVLTSSGTGAWDIIRSRSQLHPAGLEPRKDVPPLWRAALIPTLAERGTIVSAHTTLRLRPAVAKRAVSAEILLKYAEDLQVAPNQLIITASEDNTDYKDFMRIPVGPAVADINDSSVASFPLPPGPYPKHMFLSFQGKEGQHHVHIAGLLLRATELADESPEPLKSPKTKREAMNLYDTQLKAKTQNAKRDVDHSPQPVLLAEDVVREATSQDTFFPRLAAGISPSASWRKNSNQSLASSSSGPQGSARSTGRAKQPQEPQPVPPLRMSRPRTGMEGRGRVEGVSPARSEGRPRSGSSIYKPLDVAPLASWKTTLSKLMGDSLNESLTEDERREAMKPWRPNQNANASPRAALSSARTATPDRLRRSPSKPAHADTRTPAEPRPELQPQPVPQRLTRPSPSPVVSVEEPPARPPADPVVPIALDESTSPVLSRPPERSPPKPQRHAPPDGPVQARTPRPVPPSKLSVSPKTAVVDEEAPVPIPQRPPTPMLTPRPEVGKTRRLAGPSREAFDACSVGLKAKTVGGKKDGQSLTVKVVVPFEMWPLDLVRATPEKEKKKLAVGAKPTVFLGKKPTPVESIVRVVYGLSSEPITLTKKGPALTSHPALLTVFTTTGVTQILLPDPASARRVASVLLYLIHRVRRAGSAVGTKQRYVSAGRLGLLRVLRL
ncbi:hypothetical protein J8273_8000 [Carpediemonas membranifera]|uniref:Uncharacterized protein n=1 Tax=Carpediemonas membranifera TaxID=201153 RepID=A0A8J6ART5_9EUKA|nr:hypothetical protein J8273_8000 [Carpediemonas membranifera]|eukprot:KAG9390635.1 hypothetical protein J8273_8000 [Carpediemonas membranifera]